MAELLKHIYNDHFFDTYTNVLRDVVSDFGKKRFMTQFEGTYWENLALKQRMSHLASATADLLPSSLTQKAIAIYKLIASLRSYGVPDQNLPYMFLADIITNHGLDDVDTAIPAMEEITQFVSFEFAGRPFLVRYPEKMMSQMLKWTKHDNANVRRFATEGCRPRLPWGLQLGQLVKDPSPIMPILEALKDDPSEYVRKSVANNLNDISKDHPDLVVSTIKRWKGHSINTDWIVKHGARTLLKKGNREALGVFGMHKDSPLILSHFELGKTMLHLGDTLTFSFNLTNDSGDTATFRIEYYIWFVKANGQLAKKIFKISEKSIPSKATVSFSKNHIFKDYTTRKHYAGQHKISIVINGNEGQALAFNLEIY